MAAGLQTLLEAAKFIEQQEKLQLSPHSPMASSPLNEQLFLVHSAAGAAAPYENGIVGAAAHTNNSNMNGTSVSSNNIIHIRNLRHTAAATNQQVSSSAPAAAATFQHVNGVNGGGVVNGSNSQLIAAAAALATTNRHSSSDDYEFSNGNAAAAANGGVTMVTTTTTTAATASTAGAAATTNGRSSVAEGRMSEDAFSSRSVSATSNTFPPSTAFLLFSAAHEQQQQQQQQQQKQPQQQQQAVKQQPHNGTGTILAHKPAAAKIAIAVDNSGSAGAGVGVGAIGSAAASKQMLLNGGIRIASPAAAVGSSGGGILASKAINVPATSVALAAFPLHNHNHTSALPHSVPRYKSSIPLTPPPMSSRKTSESHSRTRSFSLSSNKIAANHMIVEDGHMGYTLASATAAAGSNSNSSSNHSPPRNSSGGSHYWHMASSAATQGAAGSQATHVMPPTLASSGRRRTISSNSNGAGTREVHNKLEKNRRAHLKECYETLKNVLPLKEDDRKKTSNLAILSEALKLVKILRKDDQDMEGVSEQLGKKKIILQKRFYTLKRELGSSYEKLFTGVFPETEVGSIPSERENLSDSASLSSARGSMLYSSSSSLSSGGSNGSNTMSSPVGAGLQTALPTAISPVISNNNSNSTTANNNNNMNNNPSVTATSPISPNMPQQQLKSAATASANNSPAGSPTAAVNGGVGVGGIINGANMPLSLTAKNISATSVTRGSPTPSTPSPSPSSSSGVSSSSSLISSSPPMNGVINGRSVTVNIPNGLKFQTNGGATLGTIGNSAGATAAATIITTTATAPNSNNAHGPASVHAQAAAATNNHTNTTSTTTNKNGYRHSYPLSHSRKRSLSTAADADTVVDCADGEQPAKYIKLYGGLAVTENGAAANAGCQLKQLSLPTTLTLTPTTNGIAQLQLSQVVGGGNLVVSPSYMATARSQQSAQLQALLTQSSNSSSNEVGRLPGGAELNRVPTNNSISSNGGVSGIKCNGGNAVAVPATTTFYHANGKLTLVSGGTTGGDTSGVLLKDSSGAIVSAAATSQLFTATGTSAAAGLTPLIVATANSNGGGIHYTGNFAQLLAAAGANVAPGAAAGAAVPLERLNGKSLAWRSSSGGSGGGTTIH